MKKFVTVSIMCLITLFSGFLLYGCGGGDDAKEIKITTEIVTPKALTSYYFDNASLSEDDKFYTCNDKDEVKLTLYYNVGYVDATFNVYLNGTLKTVQVNENIATCNLGVLKADAKVKVEVIGANRTIDCTFTKTVGSGTSETDLFSRNISEVKFYKYNEQNPNQTYSSPIVTYSADTICSNVTPKILPNVKHGDVIIAEFYTKSGYKINKYNNDATTFSNKNVDAYPLLRDKSNIAPLSYPAYYLRDEQSLKPITDLSNVNGARFMFVADDSYDFEFNVPSIYSGVEVAQIDIPTSDVFTIERQGSRINEAGYIEYYDTKPTSWSVCEGDYCFDINFTNNKLNENYDINKYNLSNNYSVYALDLNGRYWFLGTTLSGASSKTNNGYHFCIPMERYAKYYKIVVTDSLTNPTNTNTIGGIDSLGNANEYPIVNKILDSVEGDIYLYFDSVTNKYYTTLNGVTSVSSRYKRNNNYIIEGYNTTDYYNHTYYAFDSKEVEIDGEVYKINNNSLTKLSDSSVVEFSKTRAVRAINFITENDVIEIVDEEVGGSLQTALKLISGDNEYKVYFDKDGIANLSINIENNDPSLSSTHNLSCSLFNRDYIYYKSNNSFTSTSLQLNNYFTIDEQEYYLTNSCLTVKTPDGQIEAQSKFYFSIGEDDYYYQFDETNSNQIFGKLFKKPQGLIEFSELNEDDLNTFTSTYAIGINSTNLVGYNEYFNYLDGFYVVEGTKLRVQGAYLVGDDCYSFDGFNIYKNDVLLYDGNSSYEVAFYVMRGLSPINYEDKYVICENTNGIYEVKSVNNERNSDYSEQPDPLYRYDTVVAQLDYYELFNSSLQHRLFKHCKGTSDNYTVTYQNKEYTNNIIDDIVLDYSPVGTTTEFEYSNLNLVNSTEKITLSGLQKENNGIYDYYAVHAHLDFQDRYPLNEFTMMAYGGIYLVYENDAWKLFNNSFEEITTLTLTNFDNSSEDVITLKLNSSETSLNGIVVKFNFDNKGTDDLSDDELLSIVTEKTLTSKKSNIFYFNHTSNDVNQPKTLFEYNDFVVKKHIDNYNFDYCTTNAVFNTDILKISDDASSGKIFYNIFKDQSISNPLVKTIPYAIPTRMSALDDLIYLNIIPHPDLQAAYKVEANNQLVEVVTSEKDENYNFTGVMDSFYLGTENYYKSELSPFENADNFYNKIYNKYKFVTLKFNDYLCIDTSYINLYYTLGTENFLALQKTTLTSNGFTNENALYAICLGKVNYNAGDESNEFGSFSVTNEPGYVTFVFDIENMQAKDVEIKASFGRYNILFLLGVNLDSVGTILNNNENDDPRLQGFSELANITFNENVARNYEYYNNETQTWSKITNNMISNKVNTNITLRYKPSQVFNINQLMIYKNKNEYDNRDNNIMNITYDAIMHKSNILTGSNLYDGEYAYYVLPIIEDNCYIALNY